MVINEIIKLLNKAKDTVVERTPMLPSDSQFQEEINKLDIFAKRKISDTYKLTG